MALIKCPECEKDISDKAKSCPNCGYVLEEMKFCKFCGEKIPMKNILCTKCGRQVEENYLENQRNGQVVINNTNTNTQVALNVPHGKRKDKWVAFLLCFFLGGFGAHRFYEGKIFTAILYIFTLGFLGIGILVDLIIILCKPNPYYV